VRQLRQGYYSLICSSLCVANQYLIPTNISGRRYRIRKMRDSWGMNDVLLGVALAKLNLRVAWYSQPPLAHRVFGMYCCPNDEAPDASKRAEDNRRVECEVQDTNAKNARLRLGLHHGRFWMLKISSCTTEMHQIRRQHRFKRKQATNNPSFAMPPPKSDCPLACLCFPVFDEVSQSRRKVGSHLMGI